MKILFPFWSFRNAAKEVAVAVNRAVASGDAAQIIKASDNILGNMPVLPSPLTLYIKLVDALAPLPDYRKDASMLSPSLKPSLLEALDAAIAAKNYDAIVALQTRLSNEAHLYDYPAQIYIKSAKALQHDPRYNEIVDAIYARAFQATKSLDEKIKISFEVYGRMTDSLPVANRVQTNIFIRRHLSLNNDEQREVLSRLMRDAGDAMLGTYFRKEAYCAVISHPLAGEKDISDAAQGLLECAQKLTANDGIKAYWAVLAYAGHTEQIARARAEITKAGVRLPEPDSVDERVQATLSFGRYRL